MSDVTNEEVLYSTGEAARYIGISQSSVINYINKGWLVPDLVLPSSNGKSGRRKFTEKTLKEFRLKLENKEDK